MLAAKATLGYMQPTMASKKMTTTRTKAATATKTKHTASNDERWKKEVEVLKVQLEQSEEGHVALVHALEERMREAEEQNAAASKEIEKMKKALSVKEKEVLAARKEEASVRTQVCTCNHVSRSS